MADNVSDDNFLPNAGLMYTLCTEYYILYTDYCIP